MRSVGNPNPKITARHLVFGDDIRFAEKSWGTYTVIDVQPNSMTIKVQLNHGNQMKYHSHERRDEVWTVVSGHGRTIVDSVEREVCPGDVVTIKAGSRHTLLAELIADTDISVIEIQIGAEISQADKVIYPE